MFFCEPGFPPTPSSVGGDASQSAVPSASAGALVPLCTVASTPIHDTGQPCKMADVAGTLVTVTGVVHSLQGRTVGIHKTLRVLLQQSQSCAVPEPWPRSLLQAPLLGPQSCTFHFSRAMLNASFLF